MKRVIVSLTTLFVLGIGILLFIGEENRDRFNPLLIERDVYAFVDESGETDPSNAHRYLFLVDGVDKAGEVHEIKVTSSVQEMPEKSFLKIRAKGKYVYSYEIIDEKELPTEIEEKLEQ